jgi:hypothetical protein
MRLEGDRAHLLAEEPAGIVLGARAPLLDDDLALGADLFGVEEEILHAVGLEIDHEIDLVGRNVDVIRRDVLRLNALSWPPFSSTSRANCFAP